MTSPGIRTDVWRETGTLREDTAGSGLAIYHTVYGRGIAISYRFLRKGLADITLRKNEKKIFSTDWRQGGGGTEKEAASKAGPIQS